MTAAVTLTGLQEVLARIQEGVTAKGGGFREGVIAAGFQLEAAATEKITEVLYSLPEEEDKPRKRTGNLRASRFTIWSDGPPPPVPDFVQVKNEENPKEKHEDSLREAQQVLDQQKAMTAAVVVGYGAYYAIFVHEGVAGKFEGFKWLELALQEKERSLIDMIAGKIT